MAAGIRLHDTSKPGRASASRGGGMRVIAVFVLIAVSTLYPVFLLAQASADYPAKPVRIVVGSAPGGGADFTARILAQKLSENLKSQFVVDNRPGGGDTIAIGMV